MKHSIIYLVLNNRTSRCLKTFYDDKKAYRYCRKMKKNKDKTCRLVCVNLDRNVVESNKVIEDID